MGTYIHLWWLTTFFLEEETFEINIVEEIKIHPSCQISFQNYTIYRITKNTIHLAQPMVTEHNVAPKSLKLHAG